jgi:hypothetical protein
MIIDIGRGAKAQSRARALSPGFQRLPLLERPELGERERGLIGRMTPSRSSGQRSLQWCNGGRGWMEGRGEHKEHTFTTLSPSSSQSTATSNKVAADDKLTNRQITQMDGDCSAVKTGNQGHMRLYLTAQHHHRSIGHYVFRRPSIDCSDTSACAPSPTLPQCLNAFAPYAIRSVKVRNT